jgi:hypothetical protein
MIEAPVSSAISCKPAAGDEFDTRRSSRCEAGDSVSCTAANVASATSRASTAYWPPESRFASRPHGWTWVSRTALVRVGELGRERKGVTRALGAVDADDQWGGPGSSRWHRFFLSGRAGIDGVACASARGGCPTASRMGW